MVEFKFGEYWQWISKSSWDILEEQARKFGGVGLGTQTRKQNVAENVTKLKLHNGRYVLPFLGTCSSIIGPFSSLLELLFS